MELGKAASHGTGGNQRPLCGISAGIVVVGRKGVEQRVEVKHMGGNILRRAGDIHHMLVHNADIIGSGHPVGIEEKVLRHDDFIAGTDFFRHQSDDQSIGTAGDTDGTAALAVCRKLFLKSFNFGSENETLGVTQFSNSFKNFCLEENYVCSEFLLNAIKSHMGQWTESREDRPFTAIDRCVHLADYMASRSFIDIPCITEEYDRIVGVDE